MLLGLGIERESARVCAREGESACTLDYMRKSVCVYEGEWIHVCVSERERE